MRNLKKELREKLLAEKRQKLELRKELTKEDKDSARAIEIRKILGIATLKDILGDKYPKRVCKHCGRRAYTEEDLLRFIYSTKAPYNHKNCCKDCESIIKYYPVGTIVGEHRRLKIVYKTCSMCGESHKTSSGVFGVSNHKYDDVCRVCLGTHVLLFGKATPTDSTSIPIVVHNTLDKTIVEYRSIREASEASGVPISTVALAIRQLGTLTGHFKFFLARCSSKRQDFINKMIAIHGDTYSYNNLIYLKYSYPLAVTCRIHGDWLATPNNLLTGCGCPKCAMENRLSRSQRYLEEIPTTVYYVYFPTLKLWKIGVTKHNIRSRFMNEKLPVETLLEVTYPTAKLAYDMETLLLRATKEHTYKGIPVLLSGNTELRTANQLTLIRSIING